MRTYPAAGPPGNANYKLAGLIEMDDTYFGAPKPGKRGRGAARRQAGLIARLASGQNCPSDEFW